MSLRGGRGGGGIAEQFAGVKGWMAKSSRDGIEMRICWPGLHVKGMFGTRMIVVASVVCAGRLEIESEGVVMRTGKPATNLRVLRDRMNLRDGEAMEMLFWMKK